MNVIETELPGVLILEPKVFGDDRGFFLETWNQARYAELGLSGPWVQDNLSYSGRGVLRGLHYQHPTAQGKLVSVLKGEVFDVAVDIRLGSPTFGRWAGVTLSAANKRQFWIPPGFAHGFVVTGDDALFCYKCSGHSYSPKDEGSVRWDDPDLGISWPVDQPTLSAKDAAGLPLKDIPRDRLPRFSPAG
ncbi:dTDP-4-dehydrorhamnose 3,5-epimerase [Tautonia sociabilis]|uniref:dTDP-4-dehydrorhamnose 3,5-epimerase n=1 Tax=Tautonia sociabilis TaxID=2080755 RepID=A0A432MJS5_9BACT|nr:dTDP-4-dehydrorhamnose 3,5-epimerase [Tautonia sociabilis]RUL87651.1 dTDP-4-dehydrorhamnose 3,5-epimerase [Tautonia sociabilis]